ncbi:MAG: AhpC/TSA family protein [Bacteroidaceae bacterium]|nr:AhpC/TSA family protein [Bacteroidaceae bacterium]
MNKTLKLLLAFTVLGLASCTQNDSYTITGTVDDAQDGDRILILVPNGEDMDTLNSTTINNGKFFLGGEIDSIQMAYAIYESEQRPAQVIFFIESGDMTMALHPDSAYSEVTGTPNNDLQTDLTSKAYAIQESLSDLYANLMKSGSDEAQAQFQQAADSLQNCLIELYKNFIQENISTFAGQFYLANVGEQLGDGFMEEQIKALPIDATIYSPLREAKKAMEKKGTTAVGQPFTDFSAAKPDGKPLAVSEVASSAKVLMIDFWASWCGPCRQEMPNVKAVYEKYHSQGFEILGVSLDEDSEAWKKALADLEMTWPQISDLKGWNAEGAAIYSVRAIPATVFIKDGKIVARDVRGEELGPKVEELLK